MEQLNAKLLEYKWPALLSLVGLVLILGGAFSSNLFQKPKSFPKESLVQSNKSTQIKVDISGAVNNPAVISLDTDSRLEQAILAAGGLSGDADPEYISKYLNLSQKVADGQKIYIPFKGEKVALQTTAVLGTQSSSQINLNTASLSELDTLSGVGPVTAQKIIGARPFSSVAELLNKKVVSKATYDKIKDQLAI